MARRARTYWHKPLTDPIHPLDGPLEHLVTLGDAGQFVSELESWRQGRSHWQYAAQLLLIAGTSGRAEDIEETTLQMRRALRVEGWL